MKRFVLVLAVLVLLVVVVGASLAGTYNSLVKQANAIDGQWAQVENQLQRRYELIPGLVEAVKGYQQFESGVFTQIAEARAKLAGAGTMSAKVDAANQMEGALSRLLAVFERYPELRAIEVYTRFMDEFTGTANRVTVERQRFNDLVRTYNQSVRLFPTVFVARILGFSQRAYFTISDAAGKLTVPDFTTGK